MKINFYATLRLITGTSAVILDLTDRVTVSQLFQLLIAQFPGLHLELLDEDQQLYASIPIFVNGRNPRLLSRGLETLLEPEDEISFFPPIASGRLNVEVLSSLRGMK